MRKIIAIGTLVLFVFLLTSGLFEGIVKFLTWLVTLNMTQSRVSMAGEIFVKLATWVISYGAVGVIFNALGWFHLETMKFVYFVISTVISFALCYVIMLIETYLLYIAIALGVALLGLIVTVIVLHMRAKKKEKSV